MAFLKKRPTVWLTIIASFFICLIPTITKAALYYTYADITNTDTFDLTTNYEPHQVFKMPINGYIQSIQINGKSLTGGLLSIHPLVCSLNSNTLGRSCDGALINTNEVQNFTTSRQWLTYTFPTGTYYTKDQYVKFYFDVNEGSTAYATQWLYKSPSSTYNDGLTWQKFGANTLEIAGDLQMYISITPYISTSTFAIISPQKNDTLNYSELNLVEVDCYSSSSYVAAYDGLNYLFANSANFTGARNKCDSNAKAYLSLNIENTPTGTITVLDSQWLTHNIDAYKRQVTYNSIQNAGWTDNGFNLDIYYPEADVIDQGHKYFQCLVPKSSSTTFPMVFTYANNDKKLVQPDLTQYGDVNNLQLRMLSTNMAGDGDFKDVTTTYIGGDAYVADIPLDFGTIQYRQGWAWLYDASSSAFLTPQYTFFYRGSATGTDAWCKASDIGAAEFSLDLATERAAKEMQKGSNCNDICGQWAFNTTSTSITKFDINGWSWPNIQYKICTFVVPNCDMQKSMAEEWTLLTDKASKTFIFSNNSTYLTPTSSATTTWWLSDFSNFFMLVWLKNITGYLFLFLTGWYIFRRMRNYFKN